MAHVAIVLPVFAGLVVQQVVAWQRQPIFQQAPGPAFRQDKFRFFQPLSLVFETSNLSAENSAIKVSVSSSQSQSATTPACSDVSVTPLWQLMA
jgi:hypothetical protein